ncbi:conjugal transfer protein TraB [Solibacillus sp. R5-41]|uniref:TraB/GumN family protein n=1 Tax=Solibacillus sp. R5-41 TaxID=2048654 RepID=UPI000C128984|nr:TraB/GumN family protein [Solibacillus sp. R5-41]ATP40227.1 conjugal transfer protein TraB [Solibacillus sp. R5-41]
MRKMKKHVLATALGTTLIFTSVVPAIQAEQAVPDISPWAVETLHEGEKYGIFPMEWYYDGFRSTITEERLNSLLTLTEKKIAELNLPKNKKFKPAVVKGNTTRGDIINRLYNISAQYDVNASNDPVAYLQALQVLQGGEKGLMLDQKATTQQAALFASRLIKNTYAQYEKGAKGLAWIVEDEDTKIYLLGSIHVGVPDLYPMHPRLTDAFNESQGLFVEANLLDPKGAEYYSEKAMFTDGKTIQDAISEETYQKLEKVAQEFEIPMDELKYQKPWLISNSLALLTEDDTFGLSSQEMAMHGIDMQFLLSAMLQQKPIYELEGMQAQVNMFDSISAEAQEQTLSDVLDGLINPSKEKMGESNALLKEWFTSWKTGDAERFAKSFNATTGDQSEFNAMLFGKRDEDMAQKIATVLEEDEGTYFLVVGAGHFLVDKNIRYHLEKDGYKVVPFYQ